MEKFHKRSMVAVQKSLEETGLDNSFNKGEQTNEEF